MSTSNSDMIRVRLIRDAHPLPAGKLVIGQHVEIDLPSPDDQRRGWMLPREHAQAFVERYRGRYKYARRKGD